MAPPAAAIVQPRPARGSVWLPPIADVPTADLPLLARVERLASPMRSATASLAEHLDERVIGLVSRCLAAPDPAVDDAGGCPTASRERVARSLIAVWLVVRLRQDIFGSEPGKSLAAANSLFWGLQIPSPEPDGIDEMGATLDRYGRAEAEGLLPYLLDPFGLTTRRALLAGVGDLDERRARKKVGTFYTPGDVARLLVNEVIVSSGTPVIDPACGAGVFLRAAFSHLCCDLGLPADQSISLIYGIDVDVRAIDACGIVLVHDWLAREPDDEPGIGGIRWRLARLNLAVGNSLTAFSGCTSLEPKERPSIAKRIVARQRIRKRLAQGDHGDPPPTTEPSVPLVWHRFAERSESRFGCVLMNPPFASTGEQANRHPGLIQTYQTLEAARNPTGVNLAWPFTEVALRAAGTGGRIGIVLPLSVAYRRDPATILLRRLMARTAEWRLRFFDRAPDGVFGDDVKQRVCLATARKDKSGSVATSRLIRWSASQRAQVFRPGVGEFHGHAVYDGDPFLKIGTALEAEVFTQLRNQGKTLGEAILHARLIHPAELPISCSSAIAVAPTAYNWIGAYRDILLARRGRRTTSGKVSLLTFEDDREADAAYALLASRVFLWWWRAVGDLFHVPLRALTEAPFPLHLVQRHALDALATAGRALWESAQANAVRSTNRGIVITSYTAPFVAKEIGVADRAVARAFKLPSRFARFAREDANRLTDAGRGI
jgi:N-6 DNA Methylase